MRGANASGRARFGSSSRRNPAHLALGVAVSRRGVAAVAAACQGATLLLTWSLWQPRAAPPTLPAVDALASVPFGAVLLVTVALAVLAPRVGGAAHAAVLAVAVVPALELGLGAASLSGRLWPLVRWGAFVVHAGVLVTLLASGWNSAVWPWNLALALAPIGLFRAAPASATALAWHARRLVPAALLAYPALFYVGLVDAYVSHNLYSSNTAEGYVCAGDGACGQLAYAPVDALNVPLPPEPRLYRQWFARACEPGEQLTVESIRTRVTGAPTRATYRCPP
jgi:hypothetical protein